MNDSAIPAPKINIRSIVPASTTNGPGLRTVIWVQGCVFRCPGCFNQDLIPFVPKKLMKPRDIFDGIPFKEVEGVTISGGEPFCQAEGLAILSENIKNAGLTLMVYTGYLYSDLLESRNSSTYRFLSCIDVLVDGPYERESPPQTMWAGSGNQSVLFLSNRYNDYRDRIRSGLRMAEYHINADGSVIQTGF